MAPFSPKDVRYFFTSKEKKEEKLHYYVRCGLIDKARKLIKYTKPDLNVLDEDRNPCLYHAIVNGQADMVKLLIESGADVNIPAADGNSCICFAVANEQKDIVRLLADSGANVNAITSHGIPLLHYAVANRNTDIVRVLLDSSANVNATDTSSNGTLHYACTGKNIAAEIVEMLLDYGVNANAVNNNGNTSLHIVAEHADLDILKLLVNHGANVNAQNNNGDTIFHVASRNMKFNDSEGAKVIKFLIDSGADVNVPNQDGNTPLHFYSANHLIVVMLLSAGANVNAVNNSGKTPLNLISHPTHDSVVARMLNNLTNAQRALVSHVTMIEYCNKDTNSQGFQQNKKNIISNPRAAQHKQECQKELEELSKINVNGKSILNVLLDNNATRFANHPTVVAVLESCEEKFPIYAPFLKSSIEVGINRRKMLQGALKSIDDACENKDGTSTKNYWNTIPEELKTNILKYLNTTDLSNIQQDSKKKDVNKNKSSSLGI
ncbi:ankyrin repeat domain-containing protein [Orientia tsutsugamushi]|uniref:Ankyrin repeat-containing protein 13 n=1 Tax=Orientia tsutsugamushi TaxID=784 RepID=A0A2U3RG99_ORITS|nr:ankyrin repeat domain-containing protein [Orientia tsutsugamushi]KJV55421.1 ankyrin repeat family protein [Orientia tsutsugamushi str. Kato PP]SPR12256.1 ankyrin repeat-containing protein 13 [Orientia tsutsugamushi]